MADNKHNSQAEEGPADAARAQQGQIFRRAAIAAVLIVALLGALAVFDRATQVDPPAALAARPAEIPPSPAPVPSDEGAAKVAAEPRAEAAPADSAGAGSAESPAAESRAAVEARPAAETPREPAAVPEMSSAPTVAEGPARKAETRLSASERAAPRLVLKGGDARAVAAPADPVPPIAVLPPTAAGVPSPLPAPVAATQPRTPAPTAHPPSTPSSGFVIQLGVFSEPDNAEGLLAKLKRIGVPARIESRVVVGPFADRIEALDAQARLAAAGHRGGMIVAPR